MTPSELESLKSTFKVSGIMEFEVLEPQEEGVDFEGYASKVALYPCMFSSSRRLPFCRPVHNMLDYLHLAPAQLHTNAWRILVSYYVI